MQHIPKKLGQGHVYHCVTLYGKFFPILAWCTTSVQNVACGLTLSCWNKLGRPWKRRCLDGSACCSKTCMYLCALMVPSKMCKLPMPWALTHPHTITDSGFCRWHFWVLIYGLSLHGRVLTCRDRRSQAFNVAFRPCRLRAQISSRFSESFYNIIDRRWWNPQIQNCNCTLHIVRS